MKHKAFHILFWGLSSPVFLNCAQGAGSDSWAITVTHENDLFFNTDRDYTAGQELAVLSPLATGGPFDQHRWGFNIGQQIYTPKDYLSFAPILNDRPFAGYLYGSLEFHGVSPASSPDGWSLLHSFELQLGIIGESSLAKEAQDAIHDWRDFAKFNGWGNQLRDEPAVLAAYEVTARKLFWQGDSYQSDFLPYAVVRGGNVAVNAAAGGIIRWGRNLPDTFGNRGIRAGAPHEFAYNQPGSTHREGRWSWHLFTGLEAKYAAQDIFLDGNTSKTSQDIGKQPFVGELAAGAVVGFPGGANLSFTGYFRTREHDARSHHMFGALALGFPL